MLSLNFNSGGTKVNNEKTISQPKRAVGKVLKALSIGGALVITILIASHFIWEYSGSNRWELQTDRNGIKIYSLKAPGAVLKRFKGVTRVKITLNSAAAAMASTDNCGDWMMNCTSETSIQPWNSQTMTYIHLFRLDYPSPFSPREFLLKGHISQDPDSKAVLAEFMAAPDELPQNSCCFRVAHMRNTWRFTPVENGEVEVEVVMNLDQGLPYVVVNRMAPGSLYALLSDLPRLFNKDELRRAKFDLIREK
jgi:hypothetical protein